VIDKLETRNGYIAILVPAALIIAAVLLRPAVATRDARAPQAPGAAVGAVRPKALTRAATQPPSSPWYRNSSARRSPHVARQWRLIGGVGVNVVTADLAGARVRCVVGLARGADPRRGHFPLEDFHRIVRRYEPRVAINGTYFHRGNGQPTGSIVRHGSFLYDGRWGTTITIGADGDVRFHYRSGTYGRHFGWSPAVREAISTGPTLVRDGRLYLHPRQEGFRDPHVLGKARRSAIGLTRHNRLVLVTVHRPISLNKLAHIMLRLNCRAAANLDGGSSSGLYCNGEYITLPSRRLSNVLLVYD